MSQIAIQYAASSGIEARIAAAIPTAPIAIPAVPGTAQAPAASMEARM